MSDSHNNEFLEAIYERYEAAKSEGNTLEVDEIIRTLKENGFTKEANQIDRDYYVYNQRK